MWLIVPFYMGRKNLLPNTLTVRYQSQQNTAEAWSILRLPFEPKGWLIDLRNDLREAIHDLKNQPDQILCSIYGSQTDGYCDIENILLYNIGTAHFSSLTTTGLRFERCFSHPDSPYPLDHTHLHYHQYTMADINENFSYWQVGRLLAEWENIKIPKLNSGVKTERIWHCIKSSPVRVLHKPEKALELFGLSITIMIPDNKKVNIANFTKQVIDGIVSAFHVYQGQEIERVSQCLGTSLNENSDTIADLLSQPHKAVLGARQVVRTYRNYVKWDPADDRCLVLRSLNPLET